MLGPTSGRKSCCKPLGAAQQQGEGKKLKKQENQTGFSEPASGPSPEGAGSGLGPGPSGCNGWGAGGMAVGSAHICFEIISGRTDGQTDGLPEGQTHVPHRNRCPTALLLVPAPEEAWPQGMPEALCTVTPSPLPKRYRVCLLSYFFNTLDKSSSILVSRSDVPVSGEPNVPFSPPAPSPPDAKLGPRGWRCRRKGGAAPGSPLVLALWLVLSPVDAL